MSADWIDEAERELIGLRSQQGGWPYRRGGAAAVEPTALAALALMARGREENGPILAAADRAIETARRADGGLGIAAGHPEPGWPTPLALLFWHALGHREGQARPAIRWLLSIRGQTLDPADDPEHVVGHDTMIVGWPWVDQTHSWLEPTATAVLALERWGERDNARVVEGRRLLVDRAIAGGGWNYGNKAVFGRPLRPQPGPTGLALLALSGPGRVAGPEVREGIARLRSMIPGLRASISLGWACLGLRAWGIETPDADSRLRDSYEAARGRADAPVKLAMLLLAAGPASLALFGRSSKNPISMGGNP